MWNAAGTGPGGDLGVEDVKMHVIKDLAASSLAWPILHALVHMMSAT
jgi:hypothetical protein